MLQISHQRGEGQAGRSRCHGQSGHGIAANSEENGDAPGVAKLHPGLRAEQVSVWPESLGCIAFCSLAVVPSFMSDGRQRLT